MSRLNKSTIADLMELSESAEEIANAIIFDCTGLNVTSLGDNVYEVSSEKTGAKTWLVEKESGEIFLHFSKKQYVNITEMGPETAAIFVGRVFQSFEAVIRSRSYGYAPSFQFQNPRKIFYNKIRQPFQNRF